MQRWFAFYDSNAENRSTRWSKFAILLYVLLQDGKLPALQAFPILAAAARAKGIKLTSQPKAKAKAKAKATPNRKGAGKNKNGTEDAPTEEEQHAHRQLSSLAHAPEASEGPLVAVAACSDALKDAPDQPAVPVNGPEETTKKEEVKSVKLAEMYSAMQAAAIALASERNCLGMDVIHFTVKPIRTYYTEVQAAVRGGPATVRSLFSTLARGKMHEASAAMWLGLADHEALEACGLALECALSVHADVLPGDAWLLEQEHIAKLLDGCVLSLVAERSDEAVTHEADFIAQCAGLLHSDQAEQEGSLQDLARICQAFSKATQFKSSPTLRAVVARSGLNGSVEQAGVQKHVSLKRFILRCC